MTDTLDRPSAKSDLKVVGTRPIRPDGVDKVTGRANFGADMAMPGMLWGKIKRSPHAHARIVSIDYDKALRLPGVKAVITRDDFPDIAPERAQIGAAPHNLIHLSLNCMAKGKVLYEGHAVAAVGRGIGRGAPGVNASVAVCGPAHPAAPARPKVANDSFATRRGIVRVTVRARPVS